MNKDFLKTLIINFIIVFAASYLALSMFMSQYSLPPKILPLPAPISGPNNPQPGLVPTNNGKMTIPNNQQAMPQKP